MKLENIILATAAVVSFSGGYLAQPAYAADKPPVKAKFYDFSEQLIDGEIRKPQALYVDTRRKAEFDRLFHLKKSFLPALFKTGNYKVFK